MKFKFIYTLFTLSIFTLAFLANSGGRAASQGRGNTGAPGDEVSNNQPRTCVTCHNSGTAFEVGIGIEVRDENANAVDAYLPGQTYDVVVTMSPTGGNPSGYGFQALCLNASLDENGDDVAGFSNPGSNVQIAVADNGRQYAEQDGVSTNNEFQFQWTAPAEGSGPVTFYSCGNGVNDNNMSSGDAAACTQLELPEGTSTNVEELVVDVAFTVAPNPVVEQTTLTITSKVSGDFQLNVFDASGKVVIRDEITLREGLNTQELNMSDMALGTYILQVSNGLNSAALKIMKR